MRQTFLTTLTCLVVIGLGVFGMSFSKVHANSNSRVLEEVHFTMDDGTDIVGSVFLPPESVKMPSEGFPMVVLIHGWGGDRHSFHYPEYARRLAKDGFAVLTYDVRGFGESGGLAKVASHRELKDLHNLLYFMLANRTSYEKTASAVYPAGIKINPDAIGITGVSYGGGHSYLAAASNFDPDTYVLPEGTVITDSREQLSDPVRYPKVAAVAPIVGWSNLYQALYTNGVPKLSYDTGLALLALGDADPLVYKWLTWATAGTHQKELKQAMKERSILFDGHLVNPNMKQNSIDDLPIFMIQSWEDYLFPAQQAINLYKFLKDENPNLKLYLGNTGHPPASLSADTAEAKYIFQEVHEWFNYWLKGEKNLKVFKNRVQVAPEPGTYRDSLTVGEWEELVEGYDDLPAVDHKTYYLQKNQSLTLLEPMFAQAPDVLVTNPLNGIEDDPIVNGDALLADLSGENFGVAEPNRQPLNIKAGNVYYYTEPLKEDMVVFGQPKLILYGASSGDSIQLAAKFYDVDPQGNAQLVTRGVTLYDPAVPFTPAKVQFKDFADHHRYKKGHRMVVELGAVDFPYYQSDLTQVLTEIYHDNSLTSKIVLPVIK